MEQEQIKKLNNMCNVAYEVQLGTMLNEMSQDGGTQSNWDEQDETSIAYIKNKPVIIGKKAENAVSCEIFNDIENNKVEEGSTNSHVEGRDNTVGSDASHVEGRMCKAVGENSHAENYYAQALGIHSHAEGSSTIAKGAHAHVEGACNEANGMDSHAEGRNSVAEGVSQHVQGRANIIDYEEKYLHIVGNGTDVNSRSNAHTIDWDGNGWFKGTLKIGGIGQNDETAVEVATKTDIDNTIGRKGSGEYAEVFNNTITNIASGDYSHAEGSYNKATGYCSHAEGQGSEANGLASHAEGIGNTALADNAHAEGNSTHAEGNASHAEGYVSTAKGNYSHAEGEETIANGEAAHVEGYNTIATGKYSHVEGKYNIEDTENKYAHIVGNGLYNDSVEKEFRSNAHTVDWSGNSWYAGNIKIGGSGYEDAQAKTVATVNDIETKITSTIGDVSSLLTADKTTLVSIIQDLITRVTALENKA